jgi:hypothetical protein
VQQTVASLVYVGGDPARIARKPRAHSAKVYAKRALRNFLRDLLNPREWQPAPRSFLSER